MIQILPDIVINKLKAGEVVERPASVIKELVENSLDAQASHISIDIHDGGKQLILVQDDGDGIEYADSELILHRYATSKITSDEDLDSLGSYGFRGEALASIAEVSSITVETKTKFADIGFQITKDHQLNEIKKTSLPYYHGTKIMIRELFANTPVRKKFLKSSQTEYFYCYQMCLDFALARYDIHRTIKKNGTLVHDLPTTPDMQSRVLQVFKKDRSRQLYTINYEQANLVINAVISNSTLTFGSNEYCKIYVNGRPIQDRALQKAIMDGYHRQIAHGEYPLAIIAIDLPSDLVDVNIHPRKLQVKFVDPGAIFTALKSCITDTLGENKVFQGSHSSLTVIARPEGSPLGGRDEVIHNNNQNHQITNSPNHQPTPLFSPEQNNTSFIEPNHQITNLLNYQIIGQLRDSYIILQHNTGLQYIDQHALAERIAFEKMKKEITDGQYSSSTLLHPISIQLPHHQDSEQIISGLHDLKFETTLRGDHTLIIYKVPDFLVKYHIDIEKIMRHLLSINSMDREYQEKAPLPVTERGWGEAAIGIQYLLDTILATRACKTSIKAGHKLSLPEMYQLIQDGYTHIPGGFVCQHGRPFCIEIEKKEIDHMFDR